MPLAPPSALEKDGARTNWRRTCTVLLYNFANSSLGFLVGIAYSLSVLLSLQGISCEGHSSAPSDDKDFLGYCLVRYSVHLLILVG
jgi:hypothetical protein